MFTSENFPCTAWYVEPEGSVYSVELQSSPHSGLFLTRKGSCYHGAFLFPTRQEAVAEIERQLLAEMKDLVAKGEWLERRWDQLEILKGGA